MTPDVSRRKEEMSNAAPYLLGKLSFYSGVPRINNPYPSDSHEHREWNRGYDEAKEESEKGEDNE